MSSAAAWLSAPATTAKKMSRPTAAARDEGRCSFRRIHDTSGSSRTARVSAIATGMMTSVSQAAAHRTAATRPMTTSMRHDRAAATRKLRGTSAEASSSSLRSSRTDRTTGAGAEVCTGAARAEFFAGITALTLPIRSDRFHRGRLGVVATGSPFLTAPAYSPPHLFPELTRSIGASEAQVVKWHT